jgi:hypothetical protein
MAKKETLDWETFEQRLKELRAKYAKATSPLLFRGQANSDWPLTTTLERNGAGGMLFSDYYKLICARMGPEVQTFAGVEVPRYAPKVAQLDFSNRELLSFLGLFPEISLYRYMAYLRHFGFPSPLLDWSRSPFVAAFFAFRDDPPGVKPEKRRIYAYCEMPEGLKGGTLGAPIIHPIGPYVQTHQRHFRQRCDYTVCGEFDVGADQWRFHSHQDVFDHSHPNQDHLWEFDLPSSERDKILRVLNDYNLNAFSLFGSEESLLETMWFREYCLRKSVYF